MKNVLVFPCETEEGLELNRALGQIVHFQIFGAGSAGTDIGGSIYRNYVGELNLNAVDVVDSLRTIIEDHRIDYVYPATRDAAIKLNDWAGALNAEVVASPPEAYRLSGEGNARVHSLIDTYNVSCLTDTQGRVRFAGVTVVDRMKACISNNVDSSVQEMANAINDRIGFRGLWTFNVQRSAGGDLTPSVVMPGIQPNMGLFRSRGINLAALSLYDRMGYDFEIKDNKVEFYVVEVPASRYHLHYEYDNVYVDLDETILLRGEVNPLVVAFIFQCRNQGKTVHLITKHRLELQDTLNRYRIAQLFDQIIWLKSFDQKYLHMKAERAIFIDDAYSERKQVAEKLGIPTFEISAIESLMDWRL